MDIRLKCENPAAIQYTLTITMPAGEWEKLRDQLQASQRANDYPAWTLTRAIDDLLAQARKIYWTNLDTDNPAATRVTNETAVIRAKTIAECAGIAHRFAADTLNEAAKATANLIVKAIRALGQDSDPCQA